MNKDSQDLKEFQVKYDPKRVASLLKDLQDLKRKIEANTIPLPLPDWPDNWQCRYCQFADVCRAIGRRELSWEDFKKQLESQNLNLGL